MRGAQGGGDVLALPQGERTLAGSDSEQAGHGYIIACLPSDGALCG
jgi:hypothetical protein